MRREDARDDTRDEVRDEARGKARDKGRAGRSTAMVAVAAGLLLLTILAVMYSWRLWRGGGAPRLNVLLITLDTTRADRLGCYGYVKRTSPNLDDLARGGVLFEKAIAQAAVTPVSHASILTGLNPYRHGLRVLHGLVANTLPEDRITLAEAWCEAGGQAAAFLSAYPVSGDFGLDQGFGEFDIRFPQSDGNGLKDDLGAVNTDSAQRRADATTDAAIEWLEQADLEKPLLMWAHYFDPHDPYVLPPREVMEQARPASQEKADVLREIYDREILYMDGEIGRLFDAFKERGLWDRTVVVVTADHGEGLGDHGWWSHGILYQEQIRVPLIVRAPGIDGGRRIKDLVRTIDLMPTILDLAGVSARGVPDMDGASLAEALRTGSVAGERLAYSDSVNIMVYGRPDAGGRRDNKADKLYCLMNGRHKLIVHQLNPGNTEFYDLEADPGELNNLAPARPPEMRELLKLLEEYDAYSDLMPGVTPSDWERMQKLKGLGYNQ